MMGESGERERLCKQESRRRERKKEETKPCVSAWEMRGRLGAPYIVFSAGQGVHTEKTRQDKTETMITVRGRGSMETGQGSISSALCHWVLYCMCGGRVR